MTSMQTKAYVLHRIDRKPIKAVAEELNLAESRVIELCEREHKSRLKDGLAKKEPLRLHVKKGQEERVCEAHGPFTATLWGLDPPSLAPFCQPFWSKCPTCNAEIEQEQEKKDPKELRAQVMRIKLEAARVPDRWAHAQLFAFEHGMPAQRRVFEWVQSFAFHFEIALETGRSAMFCGKPGTGKTMLAIAVLRHVLEKGASGRYTTLADMLSLIRSTYAAKADATEIEAILVFTSPDLLVVDEVGRGADTDHDKRQFFRVLDERYAYHKPTILVSNLSSEDLKQCLGEAVCDRMRDGGGAVLTFDWASYRGQKSKGKS